MSLSPIQQKMAKQLHHSQHLLLLIFFLSIINLSHQLQSSHSQTLLKLQQLLGYPSSLSTLTTTQDFCNIEPTPYLTLVCYDQNLTQLHLVGNTTNNNFTTSLPQNFNSHTLFSTLSTLSSLKVLSLVSLGLWGPLPETIAEFSSLEILNISSNYFSGEIPVHLSYLTNLQSLVLDDNNFNGEIPNLLTSLQGLVVLSMKKNFLTGNLPNSVNHLVTLRVLDLSNNQLFGELPHLHNLVNLQVLHLENNRLGSHFPSLPTKLVSLVLRNNSFRLGVPSNISSFYQLQELDLSLNAFVGPFPPSLLSLPSINYLDVSSNKFTGMLFENFSCNGDLRFVNLSSNLLKGELPSCLREKEKVVLYARNCLSDEKKQDQHSYSFCSSEALAVNISPRQQQKHKGTASKTVLVSSSIGVVGVLIVAVVVLAVNQVHKKNVSKTPSMATLEHVIISQIQNEDRVKTTARSIVEHIIRKVPDKNAMKTLTRFIKEHIASLLGNRRLSRSPSRSIIEHVSSVNTVKLLTDARCISETMKMGTGLPAYRTFSLEQLKEATNNFDESSLISEGPLGQIYKGVLSDGMQITIRGMKIRKKHSPQSYMHHVELISKLRHSHLISSLGHSFECNQDDSSVNTIFLIFEFVQDKSLRSRISGSNGEKLCWTQRIAATIGVVKGIQYLHTGIVPGLYSNNIKITDILLDNNHNVKISSYNLPIYAENKRMVNNGTSHGVKGNLQARINDGDKNDVYDIGVILLEIILGRPIMFHNEVGTLKDLLHVSIKTDDIARRSIVDPFVHKECSDESLLKMMEICVRCLSSEPNERPSVEDILWNLQFAAQVQNSWRRETSDYRDSPKSSSRETKLQ